MVSNNIGIGVVYLKHNVPAHSLTPQVHMRNFHLIPRVDPVKKLIEVDSPQSHPDCFRKQ
jgi:hypothetical protein